jgi:inosine-uridine nucleoside N-ribohydrolase
LSVEAPGTSVEWRPCTRRRSGAASRPSAPTGDTDHDVDLYGPPIACETAGLALDLILDCDPGHDDAVALAVAAHRGRLLGVTTAAGNVGIEHTTRNALAIVQLLGIDVEVHSGADAPLRGSVDHATHVHGEHGLAGATLPDLHRAVASNDAAGYLVEITRRHEGAWIVATGPLTNVAIALQRDRRLADRVAGISIMGGGTFGNVTAVAEFNIHFDPEAADIVLHAGTRVTMCGLDLTQQLLVDDAMVSRSRALANSFGPFAADFLGGYLANVRALRGDAALHDPCAVLAVTDPHLVDVTSRTVMIETAGQHTRGMTVVDRRPWVRGGNVEWAHTIDAPAATEVVMAAFAAAP